uniref:Deacetylase sirtuin-type domain-containing protein n=1 Tax=Meloidogyne javanica TaxID=6303 RepID=A0A915MWY7_MELJA
KVAYCQKCKIGVIKPNIIFFGEDLTDQFHNQMAIDSTNVDLLIIIGSSLQVRPVPPNINVFKGAQLFYDKDQDIFVPKAGVEQQNLDNDYENLVHSCEKSSSSSESSIISEKGGSLPCDDNSITDFCNNNDDASG